MEIKKRTWNATKELFLDMFNSSSYWIFRGHKNPSWPLSTTIQRNLPYESGKIAEIESEIIREFKRAAHNYLQSQNLPTNHVEWLSLMQHHGAPTRLLDFTKSPYVAAYFALEEASKDNRYVAIWAINSYELNKHSVKILMKYKKGEHANEKESSIDIDSDEVILGAINGQEKFVHPCEPVKMNERFRIQQGQFLLIGDINAEFHENLLATVDAKLLPTIFRKILIPVSERGNIIRDLYLMNITPSTLFPGMDGYAKYIKGLHELIYKKLYGDFI